MASWREFASEVPELAALVSSYMDAHVHKTIATLRRDGSPRISGTEANFGDELWFGSMHGAMKAHDLLRDPRFALHSGSDDPPDWTGDAKIGGRALQIADPKRQAEIMGEVPKDPFHLFVADISEVVTVTLADSRERLVVEAWHEGRGYTKRERR